MNCLTEQYFTNMNLFALCVEKAYSSLFLSSSSVSCMCWHFGNLKMLLLFLPYFYFLLLGGKLLAERCRTDDLMPSIPFLCLPPSRVDPKVLGPNVFVYHSQPGGSCRQRNGNFQAPVLFFRIFEACGCRLVIAAQNYPLWTLILLAQIHKKPTDKTS